MLWARRAGWWLAALLSIGIALFSYRYLAGVGPLPPSILANRFAHPWLFVHVTGAATALLIGAFQFLPALRRGRVPPHRWIGRFYMTGCLVGGVGGLIVALGSTAGPVATFGFGALALTWIATTAQGWRMALTRRFVAHRRWMIRSWALTLAAVTLRIYLPLLDPLGLPLLDGYRAIAFLCWVPNLIVAELYLRGGLPFAGARTAAA